MQKKAKKMIRLPVFIAAILSLILTFGAAPVRGDALKGAAIGAGIGVLVGGGKGKAVRNGAIAGAIVGGVAKNRRKK